MGLLKFITCGSVDDGKSTLIGHILYDSKLIYADQEKALLLDSTVGSAGGEIDYSLLLDGLMAEREQGITIDVAYRYFTTEHRSFIVADTPGHEEYTRNMAVGASFAELAVILLDATKGVLVQTRRHARICSMMGIRHFVFAVNKMDLVDYSRARFEELQEQVNGLVRELGLQYTILIPVSATVGDNITKRSENTPWYDGPTLLAYLEQVDVSVEDQERPEGAGANPVFYMPVQRVCRPDHTFRGFQGQIESGCIHVGDEVRLLPSRETARISEIYVGDRSSESAAAGQPVTLRLDREVDVSRGSVIGKEEKSLKLADSFAADLLWMDDDTLIAGKNFFVKIGTKLIPGLVTEIVYQIDVNTGEERSAGSLSKNEIARCRFSLSDRVVLAEFDRHRTLGELILVDRVTNMTSACGVVKEIYEGDAAPARVNRDTRALLNGQRAVVVEFALGGGLTIDTVREVETHLVHGGRHTYLYHPADEEPAAEVVRHLHHAGLVVLLAREEEVDVSEVRRLIPGHYYDDWQDRIGQKPREIAHYIAEISDLAAESSDGGYI